MSWLFSQALVEAYSEENSWDGEPSAPLNVMPTPQPFWRNDKTMDVLGRSPFGLTWRPLTESLGAELLTWFRAAFPVRTSALREPEQALRAPSQDCGEKWHGSFARYDPDSCSWKTHQHSLLGGLEPYSETWPRWGLMRDGECWEQTTPGLPTEGSASGLWLTPTASERYQCPEVFKERIKKYRNGTTTPSLTTQVRHRELWPTPTVCGNHNRKGASKKSGDGLATAARQWPTPIARDALKVKGGGRVVGALGTEPLITKAAESEQKTDGRLNPEWVEWLMGWPTGWTDLKPLEMDKCQQWQQWHGKY